MNLTNTQAELFVPDGAAPQHALARTTHLGVGAHPDDLEVMAFHGILACAESDARWFAGIVTTDGRGSPRTGTYAHLTDDQMRDVRREEQKRAATLGSYGAVALLDWSSAEVKDPANDAVTADLVEVLRATRPRVLYTHDLADKHDTHVAVALRTLAALRRLAPEEQPEQIYGCEVWRGLDWLDEGDKVVLDLTGGEALATRLLEAFDSQIQGGKRYDMAAMGRWRANATFLEPRHADTATAVAFAMDLAPLVQDPGASIRDYARGHTTRFAEDVVDRLQRLSQSRE